MCTINYQYGIIMARMTVVGDSRPWWIRSDDLYQTLLSQSTSTEDKYTIAQVKQAILHEELVVKICSEKREARGPL
jgi:hypothetical protein